MIGSWFFPQFMGNSTTTDLVVEDLEGKDKSGDENGKIPDANMKLAKKPTKLTEKKDLKRSSEDQGGDPQKKMQRMHPTLVVIGPIEVSIVIWNRVTQKTMRRILNKIERGDRKNR